MARTKQNEIVRNRNGGSASSGRKQTAKKQHHDAAPHQNETTPVTTHQQNPMMRQRQQLATKSARVRPHHKELPPVKMQTKRYHKKGLDSIDKMISDSIRFLYFCRCFGSEGNPQVPEYNQYSNSPRTVYSSYSGNHS
jgi:hypothetical protein